MNVLLLPFVCFYVSFSIASAEYYELENAAQYFEDFIIKHDKHYANKHEKAARFEVFKANLEHINRLNKESDHAVFVVTRFADLTLEEFKTQYTGIRYNDDNVLCQVLEDRDVLDAHAPESFDWRDQDVITRVKDQKVCGGCWAFSATGHLESRQAMKHGKLLELSEQHIINCDQASDACCGGFPSNAFKAAIKIGGVLLEKDCPFQGTGRMACETDASKYAVNVTKCYSYSLKSQEKVKQLLYKVGPISIAIKSTGLKHHGAGILSDKQCDEGGLDHAVLLVGYGTESGIPYWTIKNSWGPKEGEDGYYRMQRSKNINGACGMMNVYMATAEVA